MLSFKGVTPLTKQRKKPQMRQTSLWNIVSVHKATGSPRTLHASRIHPMHCLPCPQTLSTDRHVYSVHFAYSNHVQPGRLPGFLMHSLSRVGDRQLSLMWPVTNESGTIRTILQVTVNSQLGRIGELEEGGGVQIPARHNVQPVVRQTRCLVFDWWAVKQLQGGQCSILAFKVWLYQNFQFGLGHL